MIPTTETVKRLRAYEDRCRHVTDFLNQALTLLEGLAADKKRQNSFNISITCDEARGAIVARQLYRALFLARLAADYCGTLNLPAVWKLLADAAFTMIPDDD